MALSEKDQNWIAESLDYDHDGRAVHRALCAAIESGSFDITDDDPDSELVDITVTFTTTLTTSLYRDTVNAIKNP